MPSLIRLLIVLAVLAGAAGAAILALATFVQPTPREMSVTIPPERLNKTK
jgi:phage shock protein PspC (stress-responsive transcriptional regulator)